MAKQPAAAKATYVEMIAALETAVAAVNAARVGGDEAAYRFYRSLADAIGSGTDNAHDTMRDNGTADYTAEEFANIEYNSICNSSAFCDNESVREWFLAHGYEY